MTSDLGLEVIEGSIQVEISTWNVGQDGFVLYINVDAKRAEFEVACEDDEGETTISISANKDTLPPSTGSPYMVDGEHVEGYQNTLVLIKGDWVCEVSSGRYHGRVIGIKRSILAHETLDHKTPPQVQERLER